jgi:DNA-binding HxlR family transcriptional regulator
MRACAFEAIVDLVGDRWSLLLIGALLDGPRRTTELASHLAPISTRTLAERLKRLESAGVLVRRAYAEAPPRVEYTLTDRGHELRPVLAALRRAACGWEHHDCREDACRLCATLEPEPPIEVAPTAPEPLVRRASVDVTLL